MFLTKITVLLLVFSGHGYAAEFEQLDVDYTDGVVSIHLSAQLAADAQITQSLLQESGIAELLMPDVATSHISAEEKQAQLHINISSCLLLVCLDIEQVLSLYDEGDGEYFARIIPEFSDFASGFAQWRVLDHEVGSQVLLTAKMEPDSFLLSLLNPYVVAQSITEHFENAIRRLEQQATEAV